MSERSVLWSVAALSLCAAACSGGNSDGLGGGAGTVSHNMFPAGGVAGASGAAGAFAGAGGAAGTFAGAGGAAGSIAGTGGVAGGFAGAGGVAGGFAGTGGAAGTGGMVAPGDGTFPRNTPVNVSLQGPYSFQSAPASDPDWGSATLYYPTGAPEPFAAMAVAPGWTEEKEVMTWWCELLASHGFVVLNTSPINTGVDQPPDRGRDLETAVAALKAENEKAGSPLMGKIATDRIALSGHSMGGGGSLYAAAALGSQVRAAIPLMEHGPYISDAQIKSISAATLFIAGELDTDLLGSPTKFSIPHFNAMSPSVPRTVAVVQGGDHFVGVNGGVAHADQARYAVAWLKIYLEDDLRYETYIYGAEHTPAVWSTYTTAP